MRIRKGKAIHVPRQITQIRRPTITLLVILLICVVPLGFFIDTQVVAALLAVVTVVCAAAQYRLYRRDVEKMRWLEARDFEVCIECGYELSGLPGEGNCPECGSPYTREQLKQLWTKFSLSRGGATSKSE